MWGALFPGQGSQQVGMGKFLFDNFKEAQVLFEEASDLLSLNFKRLCFDGPEDQLGLTENTQPALLLTSVATYQVLNAISPKPWTTTSGHSVGEYAALVTAGALKFSDALRAVRARGEAMQAAVPLGQGGMTAVIGLTEMQIHVLCLWAMEESEYRPLEPANLNAPDQVVISGSKRALDWLNDNLRVDFFSPPVKKVRLIPLKVSAPFHCSLMKPAQKVMREVLKNIEFHKPAYPVVQNYNSQAESTPDRLREHLVLQISSPVRWVGCVRRLKEMGVKRCVELGPGRVLSGLVKKIDTENLETFNVNSLEDLKVLENLV